MNKTLLYTIPKNLKLESLIMEKDSIAITAFSRINGKKRYVPTTFKPKNLIKHLKYCYYFIDLLYKRQKYNPDEYHANSYIHVAVETISKVIPKNTFYLVRNLLQHLGVIEINTSYVNGDNSFSQSFRLTDNYRNDPLKTVVIDDEKFLLKIKNRAKHKTNDLVASRPEYRLQHNQLIHLEFDHQSAVNELMYNYESNGLPTEDFSSVLSSISDLANNITYFNINNKVNRVFTTVNQSHSLIRKHIKDSNGRSLIYIDIGSSLPNLLFIYIINYLKKEGKSYKNHTLPLPYLPSFLKGDDNQPSFLNDSDDSRPSFSNSDAIEIEDLPSFLKEIEKFSDLLQNNNLYEQMMSIFKKEGKQLSRSDVKTIFFKEWLNARHNKFSKNYKIIANEFPVLSKFINDLKKEDSNLLINKLMKMEAKLVNNRIVRRIYEECDSPVVYTIFDAIMIDKDNFDAAYNIMSEEFEQSVGLPANLHVDDLNEKSKTFIHNGKDTYTDSDYLDRITKKMFKEGYNEDNLNLFMKTFKKKVELKDAIKKTKQVAELSIRIDAGDNKDVDGTKPDNSVDDAINDPAKIEDCTDLEIDSSENKHENVTYTQEQVNQICLKHFGWYREMDQEKYNDLFTPYFNSLDNDSKAVIAKSVFDMEDGEVELFGRLDIEFKKIISDYCQENGIETTLRKKLDKYYE